MHTLKSIKYIYSGSHHCSLRVAGSIFSKIKFILHMLCSIITSVQSEGVCFTLCMIEQSSAYICHQCHIFLCVKQEVKKAGPRMRYCLRCNICQWYRDKQFKIMVSIRTQRETFHNCLPCEMNTPEPTLSCFRTKTWFSRATVW